MISADLLSVLMRGIQARHLDWGDGAEALAPGEGAFAHWFEERVVPAGETGPEGALAGSSGAAAAVEGEVAPERAALRGAGDAVEVGGEAEPASVERAPADPAGEVSASSEHSGVAHAVEPAGSAAVEAGVFAASGLVVPADSAARPVAPGRDPVAAGQGGAGRPAPSGPRQATPELGTAAGARQEVARADGREIAGAALSADPGELPGIPRATTPDHDVAAVPAGMLVEATVGREVALAGERAGQAVSASPSPASAEPTAAEPTAVAPASPPPSSAQPTATALLAQGGAEVAGTTSTGLAVAPGDASPGWRLEAGATPATLPMRDSPGTPAPAGAVAAQVATAVRAGESDRIEIRLDPPELGRVQIEMRVVEGTLHALVVAERAEVSELLRRHAELLQRDLEGAGYGAVTLDFAAGREEGSEAGRDGRADAAPLDGLAAAPVPTSMRRAADGRLDIRL